MSAFNTVTGEVQCPVCGKVATFCVQFKYGDTWQYAYRLGDSLRWGGNDIGCRDAERVKVEGIGGPCPHCGTEYLDFDLCIEGSRLVELRAIGTVRTSYSPQGFVIFKE